MAFTDTDGAPRRIDPSSVVVAGLVEAEFIALSTLVLRPTDPAGRKTALIVGFVLGFVVLMVGLARGPRERAARVGPVPEVDVKCLGRWA